MKTFKDVAMLLVQFANNFDVPFHAEYISKCGQ